jgi:hypothetical protein
MRLTFIYTSLALCALCPALPLPATTLHPRGAPIEPSGEWLPTSGQSSFLQIPRPSPTPPASRILPAGRRRASRLKVDFKHLGGDHIPRAHRRAIEANIRQYHDNLRRNPGEVSSVRGARLAVVHDRGVSRDWPGPHIVYDLDVAHYSDRGLHLGNKWISTYVPRVRD